MLAECHPAVVVFGADGAPCAWTATDQRTPSVKTLVKRFAKDESGSTAIEYGLIASGIAVAILAVLQGLRTKLTNTFANVSANLN